MRDVVLINHSSLVWRASQLVSQLEHVISFTIRSHLPFRNCVNIGALAWYGKLTWESAHAWILIIYLTKKETHHLELFNSQEEHK